MVDREPNSGSLDEAALPYRPGEFLEVANRLSWLVESLERQQVTGLVPQEMRVAAAALRRAEGLLSPGEAAAAEAAVTEPAEVAAPAEQAASAASETTAPVVGQRGEWRGTIGRQPEFDKVHDGRLRGVFYLAQHPDPSDREQTEWLRCYSLGRHAEALQHKGRLAGAEVLLRGSFQGVRAVPRRDGSTVEQQTIYVYGVRVVKGPNVGPGPNP